VQRDREPARSTDPDLCALVRDEHVESNGVADRVLSNRCVANVRRLQVGVHGGISPPWLKLGNFGAPDTETYFATVDVGAPLAMGPTDEWLTIEVTSGPCRRYGGRVDGTADLSVSGQTVTRFVGYSASPGAEYMWDIFAAVPHASRCYSFSLISETQPARDAHIGDADRIITSLRFTT